MRVLAAFFFNVSAIFAIGLLVAKFLGPAEYGRFALAFGRRRRSAERVFLIV